MPIPCGNALPQAMQLDLVLAEADTLMARFRGLLRISELEDRGFQVLKADIFKLVGGYGAVHCLTAPVVRE